MNYALNNTKTEGKKGSFKAGLARIIPLLDGEKRTLVVSAIAILFNAVATLVAPLMISHAIDAYIQAKDFPGLLRISVALFFVYVVVVATAYIQTKSMGGLGRRVLYRLRNEIFLKLQSLPVAFFNQNKVGDLISRINNDTDKLNQMFSQILVQFVNNFFLIVGTGVFLLALNVKLGTAALMPALGVFVVTQLISGWVKRRNLESLQKLGGMSAEIQESLNNYKVIVAFNRADYFRKKFEETNEQNFKASVSAGFANNIFIPMYGLASNLAQIIVLAYGIVLIASGSLTAGLLVGYFLYVNNFYMPLRQVAALWASLQQAMAALERISDVLDLESNLNVIPSSDLASDGVLEFRNVHFGYTEGEEVLHRISFKLEKGKTYALVGPTGGGKTTTASIMARLYDPTEGVVVLQGKDIRAYTEEERASIIGFILQEPFLFSGTLLDNLFYGNPLYEKHSDKDRMQAIHDAGLGDLLAHFSQDLHAQIHTSGEAVSLGQRQLVAFMRAVLRKPRLLILDEATANIDTVTEQLLEDVLRKLPSETTKVIIAHRLNTIAEADEIFFVNHGSVTPAGSLEHAVDLLMHGKRVS